MPTLVSSSRRVLARIWVTLAEMFTRTSEMLPVRIEPDRIPAVRLVTN